MRSFRCRACGITTDDLPESPCCFVDEGENSPCPVPARFERVLYSSERNIRDLIKECLSVETHITEERAERGDGKWFNVTTVLLWDGKEFFSNEGSSEVLSEFDMRIDSLERGD